MNLMRMQNLGAIGLSGLLVLSACKKGIQVETFADGKAEGAATPCPDGAAECPFQMIMDARIVNTTSADLSWTAAPGAISYSLEVARDESCTKRSSLLQLTEQKTTIDFVEDGAHHFCLYGVSANGAKTAAENNGLQVIFDRTPPVVSVDTEKNARAAFSFSPAATDLTKVDYLWEVISGPGEVSISDVQEPSAIFSMSADGRYVIKLTVTDEADNVTEKEIIVDWDASAPSVNVGADIVTNSFVNVNATVDASAKTVRWEKISGPLGATLAFSAPQDAATKITADTDGVYVIRLTATDEVGNEGYDELNFTRDTTPPTVDVGSDVTIGNTFAAHPTVTDAVSYQWIKVSGPGTITFSAPTAKDTDITAGADGVYVLKLTATDVVGNSASDTLALHWTTTGPAVSVGADRAVNTTVAIDATSSGVDQWQWSKVSGPGTVVFSAPTLEDTSISVSADGTYVFRLTVTNTSTSATAFDEVQVIFDTVNPTVNVGPDLNVKVPTSVTATTSGTPGVPTSYLWEKTAGPGTITFGTPTADNTSITASIDGTYTIQLTVTDVGGNTASDTLSFVWDTTPPIVDAGSDRTLNANTALNATVTNLGGGIYAWTQLSGPGAVTFSATNIEDPSVSADTDGTYVLQLTATDVAGNSATDTMMLTWDTTPPTVDAGSDVTAKALQLLSGTVSGATTYAWSKVSGPGTLAFGSPNAVSSTVTASTDGTYVVRLTATDAAGNSASDELTLTWDTMAPTVNAGVDVVAKVMTNITGAAVGATTYAWTQSTGPGTLTFGSANALTTSVSADTDGVYVAMLTATDAAGNSATDVMTFTWDTIAPAVNAGADFYAKAATNLTPTVDPDAATFLWEKVSGPGTVTFGNANAKNTNVSASVDGTYVLRLTATDAAGNSANDLVTMTWDTTGPVVNVGADVATKVMHTINPVVSGDDAGSTYQWTKVSGTGTITFGSANAKDTTVTASTDGIFVLRLTVTDPANNSTSDDLTFEWDTTPPTVNVGLDRLVHTTATLTGSVSGATTYSWTKEAGTGNITFGSASAAITTAAADAEDSYVIRLTATDAAGNSAYDELNFDWDTSAPTVDAGSDVIAKAMTTLTGTAPGASTYAWSKASGPGALTFGTPNALSTSVSASADGTYILTLVATDVAGNSALDVMTLTWDTTAPAVNVGADFSAQITTNLLPTVDADATTFLWEKISGLGNITFGNANAKNTNVSADADGTYVLRLTATDAAGNSGSDLVTMSWDTIGPVVNVGADVVTKTTYSITPTVSDAPAGSTYQWTKVSGPGTITFGSATTKDTTASASTDGVYVLRLTVTDPASNATSDDLNFEWDTTPPSVDAGADQLVKTTTTLNGSATGAATYSWSKQSGTGTITFGSANAAITTASSDTEGTFVLRLTATDAAGNSAFDDVNFQWDVTPPTVDAGVNVTAKALTNITGTASGASTYAWSKTSGPGALTFGSANALTTSVSADTDGTYVVTLTATDAAGNSASDIMTFTWDTSAPSVDVGADFNAKNTTNLTPTVDADATTFLWEKVSGPGTVTFGTANTKNTNVSADTDGTYVLRLTATDAASNSGSDVVTMTWDATGPSVNVGADVVKNVMHSMTPTVSDDPVGSTYQWTKISGGGTITFGSPTAKNTTVSASADDVYVLRLTVTDPAGNSSSDDVNFTWDTTPPTVNVGLDRLVHTTTTLMGSVSGATTYSWTKQSGTGTITFGSASSATTTASSDTEGSFVLRLTATDAAGNSAFDELNFEWDTTAPTVDAGVDKSARVSTTVTGTSDGGTYAWTKIAGPGVITFGSPTALSTTVSASVDGVYVLQLSATDTAGNVGTDTMTFTWDTAPPTVNVGADRNASTQFSVDAVTTDGSTFAWTKVSGPGTVNFSAASSEDTDVDITGDGVYVLRLTVTDSVGNSAFDDLSVNWNTSGGGGGGAPAFTSIDLINAAGDGYLNAADRVLTSNVVGNLIAANYDAANYAIAAATDTCSAVGTYGATLPKANAAGFSTDGDYKICVRLAKSGQTNAYGESDVFHVDTVAPTFTSFPLANDAADAAVNNADVTDNEELAGPLAGREMDQVAYVIRLAIQNCSTATGWVSSIPKAGDLAGYVNGSFKVCVRITDNAGNTIYNNSPSFVLDKDAPHFSGVSLAQNTFNATDVAASTVLVSAATGSSFDHAFYKVVSSTVMNCSSGVTFDQPQDTLPTAAHLSSLADGSYKVCVKLTDDGGNAPAYGISNAFIFDQTLPVLPTDNSSVLVWGRKKSSIDLEWLASTDNFSTNVQYYLYYSTSSSFDTLSQVKAGTLFSSTTATTRTVTGLAANTAYYFAVIARDEAGNEVLYTKGTGKTAASLAPFTQIKSGVNAYCALNSDGQLFCWGSATYNFPLTGVSSTGDAKASVSSMVSGFTFSDFTVGDKFACGISTVDQLTYCWGLNSSKQLGMTDTTQRYVPAAINGGHLFTKVAAGSTHACALKADGKVFCWGSNTYGYLGDNTTSPRGEPTQVVNVSDFIDIAVGINHSCGLRSGGAAYCWGYNAYGQLGDGTNVQRNVPTAVADGLTFSKIYAFASTTCGLSGSTMYCWGYNAHGQLGIGAAGSKANPTAVAGSLAFSSVHASVDALHNCGISGTNVYCWGYNAGSQLGDGTTASSSSPVLLPSPLSFTAVAAGSSSTCGIAGGQVYCWGTGDLGMGGSFASTLYGPTQALHRPITTTVSSGFYQSCNISAEGQAYCWGYNGYGNLGNGTAGSSQGARVAVIGGLSFERVAAGFTSACASAKGVLYCWGANSTGQLGNPAFPSSVAAPVLVQTDQRFVAVSANGSASYAHTCALNLAGDIYCWGSGNYGQLGTGGSTTAATPQKVVSLEKFKSVSVGKEYTCALATDGRAFCWGYNTDGRLGDGTTTHRYGPTLVSGGLTFKSISAGGTHTCGVTVAGAGYCWGTNSAAQQLGDGTAVSKTSPSAVIGGLTFKHIYVGHGTFSCGITSNDDAYCWGTNTNGQLGDGTTVTRTSPTAVVGGHKFQELSIGSNTVCGLRTDGFTLCWGEDNSHGYTGNNSSVGAGQNVSVPTYVDEY